MSKSELQPRSFNLTLYEIKTAQPPRAIICTAEAALRLHCITNYRSSMINGSGAPARQILGNGVINGRCRTILAPPLSPSVSGNFSRAIGKTLQGLFYLFIFPCSWDRPTLTSRGRAVGEDTLVREVWEEEVLLQLGNENALTAEKPIKATGLV